MSSPAHQLGLALFLGLTISVEVTAGEPQFSPAASKQAQTDLYGDPLPPGAVARLGTVRFRHFQQRCSSVAFSPDGKTLAGCFHDVILLWDITSGKELQRLRGADGNDRLIFSPDGKLLASTNYNARLLHLWEVASGKELHRLRIWAGPVAFAPDGKTVAAGCYGVLNGRGAKGDYIGEVSLWDVASGQELRRFKGHKERITSIAFAADGKTLVSGSGDSTACLWDVANGTEIRRFSGHKGFVNAIALSPDGKLLAGGGDHVDTALRIWDVASGREIQQLATGAGREWMYNLAFAPDGRTLISADGKGRRILWDVATWQELGRFGEPPLRTNDLSFPVAFSPDGKVLAGREGSKHVICFWDTATRRKVMAFDRHDTTIDALSVSGDGKLVATSSLDDQAVQLWELDSGKPVGKLDGHLGGALGAGFARNGSILATGNIRDGVYRLWDTGQLRSVRSIQTPEPKGRSFNPDFIRESSPDMSLALSPDGATLVTGTRDGTITFWDTTSGKKTRQFAGHEDLVDEEGERHSAGPVVSLFFSSDSQVLVSKNEYAKNFVLWHPATGRKLHEIAIASPQKPANHHLSYLVAALAPNGKTLAMAGGPLGPVVYLHEITTGQLRLQFTDGTDPVSALSFAPDGRMLAVGTMKGLVRLRDVYTGAELGRAAGHQGPIRSLAFTPDSRRLISGSVDTTALVWDVAALCKQQPETELDGTLMASLWTDLVGNNAGKAYQGIGKFARSAASADFLAERLQPVSAPDAARVARLIAELDSEQYEGRQQASGELARLGELVEPDLKMALERKPSLEVTRRIDELLRNLNGPIGNGEILRQLRAIEALEATGTPAARAVLAKLANGAAGARLTREARAALARLSSR